MGVKRKQSAIDLSMKLKILTRSVLLRLNLIIWRRDNSINYENIFLSLVTTRNTVIKMHCKFLSFQTSHFRKTFCLLLVIQQKRDKISHAV